MCADGCQASREPEKRTWTRSGRTVGFLWFCRDTSDDTTSACSSLPSPASMRSITLILYFLDEETEAQKSYLPNMFSR